ncbi:MAG: NAD-dependent epimerase/dehydratase family protein, partial [Nitrospira sp.]|nr:NAD-dependent epimerase/dehydratase family protein [Nitrospira sp.]
MTYDESIIEKNDPVLVTGAGGFVGLRLVADLIQRGFRDIRCFVRPTSGIEKLESLAAGRQDSVLQIIKGNLLSKQDCADAVREVKVIYHLAAGTGQKSIPDAFMNSVVTTRNLVEAALEEGCLRRFVNVSSFAVYSNINVSKRGLLDESCPVEPHPEQLTDAYCYAKLKQDELVEEYAKNRGLRHVIVRPGSIFGPGKTQITGRVGIDTFGVFLHIGGGNRIPFTHVDNCADAIALAGLVDGVEGEVFNVVDDDLPTSRDFLRLYKRQVRSFRSFYVPHAVSYVFCKLWEEYSTWSHGQLPPVLNSH